MYFIPGNANSGDKRKSPVKRKKNKRRLFIFWTAVVLILIAGIRIWTTYQPVGAWISQSFRHHPEVVDGKILADADFCLPLCTSTDEIVRHYAYTLSYSEKDEEACWVAYTLKRGYLYGTQKRTNRFEADPAVPTGSATPDDYRNSGYDKGHLAPAADMKWNETAMRESFYLSNVCPQDHKFNDGIWADLEKAVRAWVKEDTIEYIVTGPVLPATGSPKIGADHVTVPSYFYKVVFSPCPYPKAIGFIIPNRPGNESFWHYACTVSQVEQVTHLYFYPKIPAGIIGEVKGHYTIADWKSSTSF